MKIAKILTECFQEYENEISLGLCCGLCNFKCFFCHSQSFIYNPAEWLEKDAKELLTDNLNPMHTAVVISGGEPTVWGKDLYEIAGIIKSFNLKVKIFSNAFNSDVIGHLNSENLVDMYSFDIKGVSGLGKVIGNDISDEEYLYRITKSFDSCLQYAVPFEFRITKYPGIDDVAINEFTLKNYFNTPVIWQEYVEYV